ncbi:MAG: dTDP-4-amino-4,6-dideoxygalactose transaminase [Flavobacteriales bacterium]|nr:dTDP-4-amino-4,6-dideoxygalactose transaminase [Flavobacteriales bacterium]
MDNGVRFNIPHCTGKETDYLQEAVATGKISGNGMFTKKCQAILEKITKTPKVLLTTSCTDALEMCAILMEIQEGDEVIMPSFTFVSTANAFILRGANIVFVDSRADHPGMDEDKVEDVITEKTKAIVAVHYAGVACNMEKLRSIADRHSIFLVEDAAQAIESEFKWSDGRESVLGSIGELGTLSFHETKNIQCGEGGALLINKPEFEKRAEIIWEKGTNRTAFWRGEVDKYGWVDIGSSFLPSELNAAFLYAQLENVVAIQKRRLEIWEQYYTGFQPLFETKKVRAPFIPNYAANNAHMFYLVCVSEEERTNLIAHLKSVDIHAVFHYQSLHASPYFKNKHDGRPLPWSDTYSKCLVRLPLHLHLGTEDVARVITSIRAFYSKKR